MSLIHKRDAKTAWLLKAADLFRDRAVVKIEYWRPKQSGMNDYVLVTCDLAA